MTHGTESPNLSNGKQLLPDIDRVSVNFRFWSNAGAAGIEINSTLPTVGLHLRMPGLEEAVPKVDGRQWVYSGRPISARLAV